VSLGVAAGQRTGVVGRNGSGKSTLLALLAGCSAPHAGQVTHARGLRVGLLPQTTELPAGSAVRAAVLGRAPEFAWAGDARIRAVLDGLGLHALGLDTPVGQLSGGQRRRVALAALLAAERDLLLLDEPTNHLDVEGIGWLAQHLRRLPATAGLVVVTHDRWFLDEVATTTWEVERGRVHAYDGGYAAWVLARAERARLAGAAEERRRNLLRKELAWLRRGPPARTAKPRFRVEAAAALIAAEPPPRDEVALQSFAAARLGRTVLEAEGVVLRRGARTLLDGVTWRLGPGDRVAVVGANGSGKSSLLQLLAGELAPAGGRLVRGRTVRGAHLPQAGAAAALDPGRRALETLESVARSARVGSGRELTAAQLLDRLGFAADQQHARVRDLSGGEGRRLQLVRLLIGEPNVLLLDEPTNDLDVDTLAALEDLLDGWPGTLVVASHDRWFLERTCNRTVALLGDGRLTDLPGGIEEYLSRRRAAGPVGPPPAEAAVTPARAARDARKAMARLERQLERLAERERRLHADLAEQATDYQAVTRLDAELRALRTERASLEDAWLAAAEST